VAEGQIVGNNQLAGLIIGGSGGADADRFDITLCAACLGDDFQCHPGHVGDDGFTGALGLGFDAFLVDDGAGLVNQPDFDIRTAQIDANVFLHGYPSN